MQRPALCPEHPHKYRTGCGTCRHASAAYHRWRRAEQAAGTWGGKVPVAATRDHVRRLRSEGMRLEDIVTDSGLSRGCLNRVVYDTTQTLCHATTATAILAVTLRVDRRVIDATGTRRRLQALRRNGWSLDALASHAGYDRALVGRWANRRRINRESAGMVAALYNRLYLLDGPSSLSRIRAEAKGFPPPEAWSPETIDDPSAEPYQWCRDAVDDVAVRRALDGRMRWAQLADPDRREVIRRLYAAGHGVSRLRGLVDVGTATLNNWCTKTGFAMPNKADVKAAA